MRNDVAIPFALLLGLQGFTSRPAFAAEDANGTYLLGSKQEMAGYLPPPGVYVADSDAVHELARVDFDDWRFFRNKFVVDHDDGTDIALISPRGVFRLEI